MEGSKRLRMLKMPGQLCVLSEKFKLDHELNSLNTAVFLMCTVFTMWTLNAERSCIKALKIHITIQSITV